MEGTGCIFSIFSRNSVSLVLPVLTFLGMTRMEIRLSASKEIARYQVAFSRKSAVLRTPMIWPVEPKLAARPPPLEFCTRTTRIKRIQAIKMRTDTKI